MKKTVILILVLLPIVLVITIAFAGKILSLYHHIPVEKVEFVDDVGDALDDDYIFVVNVDETKSTSIRIFPEMASNKKVLYTVQDDTICSVDENGNITGIAIGSTSVIVTTSEGSKTDMLNVLVVAERVTGITLPYSELTMNVGEQKKIVPTVEPYTALNKNVTYESSAPDVVSVKPNGYITALAPGKATITVSAQDGGFSTVCEITVIDRTPPLMLDLTDAPNVSANESGYIINFNTIDLAPYLKYDSAKIDPSAIRWNIASGNKAATLTDTTLTITATKVSVITVQVYVGDPLEPTYEAKVTFFYQP